jgi:uncharacterized protein YcbK (DUF882 family)
MNVFSLSGIFSMDLVAPNFTVKEMRCPCGCELVDMDVHFMDKLQELRDILKQPVRVLSGYRCINHNEKVGGVKNSRHLIGIAADVSTWGMSSEGIYRLLRESLNLGFTGIGVGKNYIHLDNRKSKGKMWVY